MAKIEEIIEDDETVPPPKINNANLGELKATTDDAIAPVPSPCLRRFLSLSQFRNHYSMRKALS